MLITITVIASFSVTVAAWLASRFLPFKVCPVCAGVFLTWAGLLGARFLGYEINPVVPALLMGGTVVGIAYQLEKKLQNVSSNARFLWKTLFIPTGFVSAYSILAESWTTLSSSLAFLSLMTFLLLRFNLRRSDSGGLTLEGREGRETAAEDIEKKMKDCC